MKDPLSTDRRLWWTINVTGYGDFQYFGTEAEAEEMRAHKAEWEGGRGSKRKATKTEAQEGVKHLRWRRDNGYPMEPSELEAIA